MLQGETSFQSLMLEAFPFTFVKNPSPCGREPRPLPKFRELTTPTISIVGSADGKPPSLDDTTSHRSSTPCHQSHPSPPHTKFVTPSSVSQGKRRKVVWGLHGGGGGGGSSSGGGGGGSSGGGGGGGGGVMVEGLKVALGKVMVEEGQKVMVGRSPSCRREREKDKSKCLRSIVLRQGVGSFGAFQPETPHLVKSSAKLRPEFPMQLGTWFHGRRVYQLVVAWTRSPPGWYESPIPAGVMHVELEAKQLHPLVCIFHRTFW
ncbi:hypothetical protein Pcinc_044421 [Petrolisthes cinctipes]|uniref:Uncharacterized protein n=1 Tax=Petrolisthes cinctipes TaxID=88211 RepID=A0AAE1EFE7_PETCI|nr:hypothetical protein Pcinc_044421 [Petrolisthes cinctipes]